MLTREQMGDEHRILVDGDDRLGNVAQIAKLSETGYRGAYSYECFAPSVHQNPTLEADLATSLELIKSSVAAEQSRGQIV
jgi:2-keto-myo-inositol isomerase